MISFNYSQAKEVLSAFNSVESGFKFNVYLNINGNDVDIEVYSYQEVSTILVFTISKRSFHQLKGYGFTFDDITMY